MQLATEKKKLIGSFIPGLVLVSVLWLVEGIEQGIEGNFVHYGIYPRSIKGLGGILFAPFIHDDYNHLLSNTFPLLVASLFIFQRYDKIARELVIWLFFITNFWTWCFAREAYHIGASGLVYAMISFIFFSGVIRREPKALALALAVTFLYGSMVWGVLPLQHGVSWESHLMGSISGAFFAFYFRKANREPHEAGYEEIQSQDGFYEGFYENEDWRIDRLHVHKKKPEDNKQQQQTKPSVSIKYVFVPNKKGEGEGEGEKNNFK